MGCHETFVKLLIELAWAEMRCQHGVLAIALASLSQAPAALPRQTDACHEAVVVMSDHRLTLNLTAPSHLPRSRAFSSFSGYLHAPLAGPKKGKRRLPREVSYVNKAMLINEAYAARHSYAFRASNLSELVCDGCDCHGLPSSACKLFAVRNAMAAERSKPPSCRAKALIYLDSDR